MKDITVTAPDGKQSHLENVYIRGNMIRFVIVPDMLQQAPMFKRIGPNAMKGRGIGSARGRATILRGESVAGYCCLHISLADLLSVMQLKHDVDEAQQPDQQDQDQAFDDNPPPINSCTLAPIRPRSALSRI